MAGFWMLPGPASSRAAAVGNPSAAPVVDAAMQERVARLVQAAMGSSCSSSDDQRSPTNSTTGVYTNAELNLREASRLMPERLDLRFGLASLLVGEAAQTNGAQLELKMLSALRVYQDIRSLDTNGFEAAILCAAYTRAMGQTNASEAIAGEVIANFPERTREYLDRFGRIEEVLQLVPTEKVERGLPKDKRHAIVMLGAGLETNGTAKAKLVARLKQGWKLARIYSDAPIILTGGNPKGGMTEAYAMSLWLLKKGVSRKRLYLEDQARDTVGNACFSATILKKLGVTHITLVTSNNHIRRGLADLEEACLQRGLHLQYCTLVAAGEKELDMEAERIGTYRDVMRLSGLWSFPGVQR